MDLRRHPPARSATRLAWALVVLATLAGCSSAPPPRRSSGATGSTATSTTDLAALPPSVAAELEPLSPDGRPPVVHDNETMALTAHAGRLFAATDQWTYTGPHPAGQILVKDGAASPWRIFEQTQSLRVQAVDSFALPTDQGMGPGHSLLVTQAVIGGRSKIQWLLDDADAFTPSDAHPLSSNLADVRSFGAHEDGGVWSVYAGANPDGILRGTWSPRTRSLVFDPKPELTAAPPGSPGLTTRKVTGFADCGGALYVSISTDLYRRNDGRLPNGSPRWSLVYRAPAVGAHNSGIRGLTCVRHDGQPALLFSTEGNGDIFRIDHLPSGRLGPAPAPLVPTLELATIPAIRSMLVSMATPAPATGSGSVAYVIAAYNDFTQVGDTGTQQLTGFEWGYAGACAPARRCGPVALRAVHFDAAACFLSRTDDGSPTYGIHCLRGPDLTPSGPVTKPIRAGQAFVSIRTIAASPFGDGRTWFGGYDCNFYPADGTAWVASAPVAIGSAGSSP